MKTRKAITKRFKITKSGKVLYRPTGQAHFRSKKNGKEIRQLRGWRELDKDTAREVKEKLYFASPKNAKKRKIKNKA